MMFLSHLHTWSSWPYILREWLLKRILDLKNCCSRAKAILMAQTLLQHHLLFWPLEVSMNIHFNLLRVTWEAGNSPMTWFPLEVVGKIPSSLNNINCYWSKLLQEGRKERKEFMEKRAKNMSRKQLWEKKEDQREKRENEISNIMMPAFLSFHLKKKISPCQFQEQ